MSVTPLRPYATVFNTNASSQWQTLLGANGGADLYPFLLQEAREGAAPVAAVAAVTAAGSRVADGTTQVSAIAAVTATGEAQAEAPPQEDTTERTGGVGRRNRWTAGYVSEADVRRILKRLQGKKKKKKKPLVVMAKAVLAAEAAPIEAVLDVEAILAPLRTEAGRLKAGAEAMLADQQAARARIERAYADTLASYAAQLAAEEAEEMEAEDALLADDIARRDVVASLLVRLKFYV
jgi:hypothetical protein